VYDMYPWDRPVTSGRGPAAAADPATQAVQVALDRRDNGGAAAASPAPTASPAAKASPAPTASPAAKAGPDSPPPTRQ
jgi:hypothetical protein